MDGDLGFRPMTARDLPTLRRWLSEGAALTWYANGVPLTDEALRRKYLPRIEGREPVEPWIATLRGEPIGYFQCYRVREVDDHPAARLEESACAIDFFLAEEFVGKGIGPLAIQAFLRDVVFAPGDVTACWADPDPRNLRSVRALQRAGFRDTSVDAPDARLMRAACPTTHGA